MIYQVFSYFQDLFLWDKSLRVGVGHALKLKKLFWVSKIKVIKLFIPEVWQVFGVAELFTMSRDQ